MAFKTPHTVGCDHAGCTSELTVWAQDQDHALQTICEDHGWHYCRVISSSRGAVVDHLVTYCPTHASDMGSTPCVASR